MKLVWHAPDLLEVDWLRDMFGSLIDAEEIDLDLTCFDDDTIHVVSSNWKPLPAYEEYFRECRARCRHLVLFHASDEFFSGGYALYRHFDAVIRNFRTGLAAGPCILTIPEGYSNATRTGPSRRADERRYAWSFTGEIKASRIDMKAAMTGFQPELVNETASISARTGKKLSKAAFDDILEDTTFSPCPMGNVILETWRLYESLERGCIPLVERRPTLDYYADMFGPHPIPTFGHWKAARRFAETTFSDRAALVQLQAEIGQWWAAHKIKVRGQIRNFVEGPSQNQALSRYGSLARNRYSVLHEPLRIAELLRHQSIASLRRRLVRPGGPLKRIANESLRQLRPRAPG